jgi:ABC-type multidrug transport system fused ATPase/permease subunit
MSEGAGLAPGFIKEEKLSETTGILALNRRLFLSLPLFLRLAPLSVGVVLVSSAVPSLFRWYSGKFSSGVISTRLTGWGPTLRFSLLGLVVFTVLGMVSRIAAWALFELSGMWSAQKIHERMVHAMTATRTTFFDENPSGRLINRLVRDFDEVRSTAIIFPGDFLNASVEILSIAVVAGFSTPWATLLVVPLLGGFAYMQTQRSQMLEHARGFSAIATSQVLGRKSDLIEGREIFLLYGRGERLLRRMTASFRTYVEASAITFMIETWASFWIRLSAEAFGFSVMLTVCAALSAHRIDAALAGVIISSLFGITGSIGWLDFASGLISRSAPHVRRVFEFVDLPREEDEERTVSRPLPAPGPGAIQTPFGDIVFEKYSMSYRSDTPVILDGLNLTIPWGSKTALIGRTGSGKTSLVQALLRMVHVQGGDIKMGGQSIFDMNLHELRRAFGVVPQSPYLFEGTIRSNLDRLGLISQTALVEALEAVGLDYRLDHKITEGGQNLSVGERQLVCLARVLASNRSFILMDEPTSGLDPQTDARVSQILKTALRDKTVLTIAHRRESLGHYDRVIEMAAGRVL